MPTINTSTEVQQPGTKEASLSDSHPLPKTDGVTETQAKKRGPGRPRKHPLPKTDGVIETQPKKRRGSEGQ